MPPWFGGILQQATVGRRVTSPSNRSAQWRGRDAGAQTISRDARVAFVL